MTPVESRVLDDVSQRPGRKAYEIAEAVRCEIRGVESALRLLERSGFVRRGEDEHAVTVWFPAEPRTAA